MATNKERIENLEVSLGGLHDSVSRMELGMTDKLHHLEDAISKLSEALLSKNDSPSKHGWNGTSSNGRSRDTKEATREIHDEGRPTFSSKLTKLDFPRYSGKDPTEWLTRVEQFFDYQCTLESQ